MKKKIHDEYVLSEKLVIKKTGVVVEKDWSGKAENWQKRLSRAMAS
jgi:hypothetical protein